MHVSVLTCYLFSVVTSSYGLLEYLKSNRQFTSSIYKLLSPNHKGNLVICPVSAHTVLALAAVGARNDTAQQLTKVLSLPSDQFNISNMFRELTPYLNKNFNLKLANTYQLASANKIFSNSVPIRRDYKRLALKVFKTNVVHKLNFTNQNTTATVINGWTQLDTNKKIENLIDPEAINPDGKAILTNTIYFKGYWKYPLHSPFPMLFHATQSNAVHVPSIRRKHQYDYHYNAELDAQFLELPFVGGDVLMVLVVPGTYNGLSTLENSVSKVIQVQPFERTNISVILPSFTMESNLRFKSILQALGASLPFEYEANFEGITNKYFNIDEVFQKSFIEIGGRGSSRKKLNRFRAVKTPTEMVIADRPFMYYLKHRILGVFLIGRYTGP